MLASFLIGGMIVSDSLFAADPPLFMAASGGAVTAPAGIHLMVQMTQTINSRQHRVGHKFTAALGGGWELIIQSSPPTGPKFTAGSSRLNRLDV